MPFPPEELPQKYLPCGEIRGIEYAAAGNDGIVTENFTAFHSKIPELNTPPPLDAPISGHEFPDDAAGHQKDTARSIIDTAAFSPCRVDW